MRTPAVIAAALLLAATGCSGEEPPTDGDAVVACRAEVADGASGSGWPVTVRTEGEGWVVNVWTDGERAEGVPDHVCEVAPDADAESGVRVTAVRP